MKKEALRWMVEIGPVLAAHHREEAERSGEWAVYHTRQADVWTLRTEEARRKLSRMAEDDGRTH